MKIAVLFARKKSVYKTFDNVDVYDLARDARTFKDGIPVIAHPPCRAWGRLSSFAKPSPGESELAFFAIDKVRQNGGVLEHPAHSKLWKVANLPSPGEFDAYGGYTIQVLQCFWGHRAPKPTFLYISGVSPGDLPPYEFFGPSPGGRIEFMCTAERESTPKPFADFLLQIALASKQ